jgi:uncharacterized membrane protein YccC
VPWLRRHDPALAALRRAGRAAIVTPILLGLGVGVLHRPALAIFSAFGSFSMLLFVDVTGPIADRVRAQLSLALSGLILICVGTVTARPTWLAVLTTAVVAFAVLFAGVVSSVIAGASTALLLPFILPVTLPGPISALPDRLAGWALAGVATTLAVWLLWPTPSRQPLRDRAIAACAALADRLRVEVARVLQRPDGTPERVSAAIAKAEEATIALHHVFYTTSYRPTGLSTEARTLVRLVDELGWLHAVVAHSGQRPPGTPVNLAACDLKLAAADALSLGGELLDHSNAAAKPLTAAMVRMHERRDEVERAATDAPPSAHPADAPALLSALDPGFRAQEVYFAVAAIVGNIELTTAAEGRTWVDHLLGRQPTGVSSTASAAWQRLAAHLEPHSVWLHNSIRSAIALAVAVLAANLTGVQHSFWVVLGTLTVLRSNAVSTGENAVRGFLGTLGGIVVGVGLVGAIGHHAAIAWILLPVVVLIAGVAPATFSFAVGQGAFTVALLVLFTIVEPVGPIIGLIRIEDIAIGSAVSLVVGLLFWPRGAGRALRLSMAEAYTDSASYLRAAVEFGAAWCSRRPQDRGPAPYVEANRAAASARRMDDAFRTYLNERGAQPLSLMDVTSLVTGVAGLRIAADAVLDLWEHGERVLPGDRSAAQAQLRSAGGLISDWYVTLAAALAEAGPAPEPMLRPQPIDDGLLDAVRRDLSDSGGRPTATAVRIIWTGDHLDAARRLQVTLVEAIRGQGAREPILVG